MAMRSTILAWEIPQTRGAWQATVPGMAKEVDTTWQLNKNRQKSMSVRLGPREAAVLMTSGDHKGIALLLFCYQCVNRCTYK